MTHQQLPLGDQDLRRRASTRLKQKRDFGAHLFIYLVVNGFLIGIWAFTGAGFSGRHSRCSLGHRLVLNAWEVYWRRPVSEDRIRQEMARLR
jgi:hypothetical protein